MRIPLTKELSQLIILPFIAVAAEGLIDFLSNEHKRDEQNIAFLIVFGIPAVILALLLLNKGTQFKKAKKVRTAQRLMRLPFRKFNCLFIFIISTFFIVGGLASIAGNKDLKAGLPMLLIGAGIFLITATAHEHPKIWFVDTINYDDDIETLMKTPKEEMPMYKDGIFTYADNGFTIKLKDSTKAILWDEISLIRAYKRDDWTTDTILIEVQLSDWQFTVSDNMEGYMKFMDIAAEKLPGFKKDWFGVVAFPAFKTNLTLIYQKKQVSG